MATTKGKRKWQTVSLPAEFLSEVREHVLKSKRYRSIAEFIKIAAMNQIDKEKSKE